MAHTSETVVIADYDYGNVDIERTIIEQAGFELIAAQCKTEEEVIEVAHGAAAIVAQYATISARVIAALPHCRVIARYGTGADIVDVEAATEHNILVTNVPNDWCENEVADHAMALLLAVARKVNVYDRATRSGTWQWQSGEPIHRLRGSVLGLLSFGAIARAIAARAAGFGMRITAHDPYMSAEEITATGTAAVSFDELVADSDCLVIQAPLTPQTHHLFDEAQLRRMKRTAILINTARGPIVDDRALHRALREGWIAGAGLDDIEEEPAKVRDWQPENPLFSLNNVIITPHAAYYSEEAISTVRHFAAEEVVRVLSGQPPRSPVNAGELAEARWSRSPQCQMVTASHIAAWPLEPGLLSEGPRWHAQRQELLWVDILGSRFHRATITSDGSPDQVRTMTFDRHVGAVAPVAGGGYVLAAGQGFLFVDEAGSVRELAQPEAGHDDVRMNDAACDPQGRFWAGTMAYDETPGAGTLYRLELDGSCSTVLRGLTISNGIGWSPDGAVMYLNDSGAGLVEAFEFDGASGAIDGRRTLVHIDQVGMAPDGLTVDEQGDVWVAMYGGWAVHRYGPEGSLRETVQIPAAQATSCAFGGSDGGTLFVTTGRERLEPPALERQPDAGRVFAIRGLRARGPACAPYRGQPVAAQG